MMKIEDLKESIEFFINNSEKFECEVYFLLDEENSKEIKFADIASEAQKDIKDSFLDHLKKTILNNNDLNLSNISDFDDRKNFIFKYDFEEKIKDFEIFETLKKNHNFDTFSFKANNLDQIYGIVFLLSFQNKTLISYKQHYPINVYKRDSNFLGLIPKDERFIEVTDDIIKIFPSYDFFYINDDLFVKNLKVIETKFEFKNVLEKKASETIKEIISTNLIDDTSFLNNRLDDLKFVRKLSRIGSNSVVLSSLNSDDVKRSLNVKDIENFIGHFEILREKIHINQKTNKLILKTKISQDLFLKILNDDYLTSLLTSINYDSSNKDKVISITKEILNDIPLVTELLPTK